MKRTRVATGLSAALALVAAPLLLGAGSAAQAVPGNQAAKPVPNDVRELSKTKSFKLDGKTVDARAKSSAKAKAAPQEKAQLAPGVTPPVGTVRQWLALDDEEGTLYRKDFTLRAVGDKIEVWVANDTAFPEGDCRTAAVPSSTTVTDAQAQQLASEFDTNMFPKESAAFSVAPDRDGTNASVPADDTGNGGDYGGEGDKIVTLVDNVRDGNYYDFANNPTYIAGFFSSQINELLDRNVMTIDAFDWEHRTGASPPDGATDDPCSSRPARPNLYAGTFAHEYQHLLQYYTDPLEASWINEGLSDWAQSLVGYVDTRKTVFQYGADSHIYCFQGYGIVQTQYNPNPRDCGGPENSLTGWGDQGDSETLADYGNAYAFMTYLYDRYGTAFMSALHRDGEDQGLAGVAKQLKTFKGPSLYKTIHDFQTTVLLDKIVSGNNGTVTGIAKSRVTTAGLNSSVNLLNPDDYDSPGAPYNGADYVPLRGRGSAFLAGKDIKSLNFTGSKTLPVQPLAWTIDSADPDRAGNPVLFSGNANNTDASAVTPVTVPAANPTLSFLAKFGAEAGYDYGYIIVSTDGGATYTTVAPTGPAGTTGEGALGIGLNGTTDGFQQFTADLSAYAGQNVVLGFRYISDGGVNEGGLKIDDVAVGGTVVSDGSSLAPWKSLTQVKPINVENWNVRIVGVDEAKKKATYAEYNGYKSFSLGASQLAKFKKFPVVVVIVGYDESTELVSQYARYTLKANGVTQAGG